MIDFRTDIYVGSLAVIHLQRLNHAQDSLSIEIFDKADEMI